jgi:hypothetical protein
MNHPLYTLARKADGKDTLGRPTSGRELFNMLCIYFLQHEIQSVVSCYWVIRNAKRKLRKWGNLI